MKRGYIIGIVSIVAIASLGTYAGIKHFSKEKSAYATSKTINLNQSNSINTNIKSTFSNQEQKNYYKLSQNVGDIGVPSSAMTTNLNQPKTINGIEYYKTYSYNTRCAYGNDKSQPTDGNYAHLVSSKIISLNGQTLQENQFGQISANNLSKAELENQIYKIASLYVEGYTSNNPNLETNANDDYEANLNALPHITINLNNKKNINNETLYNANVTLNNHTIPIYVGLDGFIFVSNENYYNELFFPNNLD